MYLYVFPGEVVRFFVHKSYANATLNALVQLKTPSQTRVLVVVDDGGREIFAVLREFANFEPHENIVFRYDMSRGTGSE